MNWEKARLWEIDYVKEWSETNWNKHNLAEKTSEWNEDNNRERTSDKFPGVGSFTKGDIRLGSPLKQWPSTK